MKIRLSHLMLALSATAICGILSEGFAQSTLPPARTGRFSRGNSAITKPEFQTLVVAVDSQKGVALDHMGNSTAAYGTNLPWCMKIKKTKLYHADGSHTTNQPYRAVYPVAFENPVAAFGCQVGGSALYANQNHRFGLSCGSVIDGATNDFEIAVYRKSDFLPGLTNVAPFKTYSFTIPKRSNPAAWAVIATNNFAFRADVDGLKTTVQYIPSNYYGDKFGSLGGITNASYSASGTPFIVTHNATSTNYCYTVKIMGQFTNHVNNAVQMPMVVADATNILTRATSPAYTLDFDERPPWRSIAIDQPHFEGAPMPPIYAGKSTNELLKVSSMVTNQFAVTNSDYLALDNSPELRRHPILDKFVADMGNDPIGLINYVLNEIEVTDALAYNEAGAVDEKSINLGGMDRGALATYMEGQGSPMEQCALLVYLLRKAGVPAGYVFAPQNSLKMLDARMSKILGIQIKGYVNSYGQPASPQIIPVNYPWVAAYINGKWVHIFPWMKDTEIKEGYNLYDFMPEGYNSGYKWVKNYLKNDPAIMSPGDESDVPRVLFPRFIEKTLQANHPGTTLEDLGMRVVNRRNYFTRIEDFPQPWELTPSATPLSFLKDLGSKPNLFNTISVTLSSKETGRAISTGEMYVMDIHNRRLLVRFEKTREQTIGYYGIVNGYYVSTLTYHWHNMILSMEPFRADATTPGSFSTANPLGKQTAAVELHPFEDYNVKISMTYRRHRNLPVNFVPVEFPYLGLREDLEETNELTIRKGDLAAICLNFGRVSQKMLDVHAEKFWRDQQSGVVDTESHLGTTTYLMGQSYHLRTSQWDDAILRLHKRQHVSRHVMGLAKLFSQHETTGPFVGELPGGQIHYIMPGVDMIYGESAFLRNSLVRRDTGDSPAITDANYLAMYIAGGSAEEHHAIKAFFENSEAVSTIKLIQLANQSGRPMVELNQTDYISKGNSSYTFESQTSALKDWDPSMWTYVKKAFESAPTMPDQYAIAFMTPGSVRGAKGNYKGMGALTLNENGLYSYYAALISGNTIANGGWGSYFDRVLDQPTWADFDLRSGFDGYHLDYMPSLMSDPDLAPSILSPRSVSDVLQDIANQTAWVDDYTFRSMQETSVLLGLGPITSNTGQSISDVYREIENRGSVSATSWWGAAWDKVSDPVHAITGEFYIDAVDLALNGPMPLSIRRNYGSQNLADNDFGYGWKLAYFPYLSIASDQALIYAAEMDGSVIAYRRQADPNLWLPTAADNPNLSNVKGEATGSAGNMFNAKIVKSVSGSQTLYTLTGPDGSIRTFEVRSYPTPGPNVVTRQRPYLKKWQDSRGNFYTFTFGEDSAAADYGLLVRIAASNGNFIGLIHDTFGHITEAFTGDGRRIYYEYDKYGDLVKVTLPDGSETAYEYKHNSQLVNGEQKFFSEHLILRELKPGGRILVNEYDSKRRATKQYATVGTDLVPVRNATFEYFNNDAGTGTATITGYTLIRDAYDTVLNPRITRYDYDKGQVTKITDALGQTIVQEWYQPGDVTAGAYPRSLKKRTDNRGFVSEFQYDAKGNLTQIKQTGDVTGDGVSDTATQTFTYNALNMITQQVDPVGNRVVTVYGNASYPYLPTSVEKRTASGSISTTTYQYFNVTSASASSFGLLQQVKRAAGTTDEAVTVYAYNANGFPTSITRTTGTSDPTVVVNYTYNLRGEVVEEIDGANRKKVYAYDARGNRIWEERRSETGALVGWLYNYYNHNGEIEWTDGARYSPEDYVWRKYDGAGRLSEEIRWRSQAKADGSGVEAPSGIDNLYSTTFYTHDLFGNLTEIRDARRNSTKMTYDKIGRMLTRNAYQGTSTLLSGESFGYEPGGNVSTHTNPLGGITTKLYTANGLLKQQNNPDGTVLKWTYLLDGRLSRETLSNGTYIETAYDDLNRKITKTLKASGGTVLSTTSTSFDRRGNAISRTDAEGFVTTTAYDDLDRAKTKTGPPAAGSSAQQITTYTYDNGGKLLIEANSLNEKSETTFDVMGRPTLIQVKDSANAVVRQTKYTYSADHHSVTTTVGSGSDTSGSNVPVIRTTYTDTFGKEVLNVASDGMSLMTRKRVITSVYDNGGNQLSVQRRGLMVTISLVPPITLSNSTTTYSYDALGRKTSEVLSDGATTTFSYDAAGNLLSRAMPAGLTWQATYDNASRIKTEKLVGAGTTTYAYAASGVNVGLLSSVTDPRGIVRTTTYDEFLRPKTVQSTGPATDPLTTLTYTYDRRGLVKQIDQTYANASWLPTTSLKRTFDGYGQIADETVSIGGTVARNMKQAWNSGGRRSSLTDVNSTLPSPTLAYTHRADGLLTRVTANGQNCDFVYADNGLLVSTTTPWMRQTYTHRRPGVLAAQYSYVGSTVAASEVITWSEDLRPYACSATYFKIGAGNTPPLTGNSRSRLFNSRGQLTNETLNVTLTTRAGMNFGFTPLGLRNSAKIETGAPANWENLATTINSLSQVTAEKTKPRAFVAIGLAKGAGSVSFSVDGQPFTAASYQGFQSNGIWSASIDVPSGLHSLGVTASHPSRKFTATNSASFKVAAQAIASTYDASGNVRTRTLEDGIAQTLTWDSQGRLVKVTQRNGTNNGFDWTAIYDGLGRRLRTIEQSILANAASGAAITLDSWFDPEVEFLETAVSVNGQRSLKVYGPDLNERYGGLQGIGGLKAVIQEPSGQTRGAINDCHGNIIGTSTGTDVTWSATLLGSYGPVPHAQVAFLTPGTDVAAASAWHGKRMDPTGFYYLGARYYDPNGGRFISPDPLGHDSSMSLYDYANGNPAEFVDPDGRFGKGAGQAVEDMVVGTGELIWNTGGSLGYGAYTLAGRNDLAETVHGDQWHGLQAVGQGFAQLGNAAAAGEWGAIGVALTGGEGQTGAFRTGYAFSSIATLFAGEAAFGKLGKTSGLSEAGLQARSLSTMLQNEGGFLRFGLGGEAPWRNPVTASAGQIQSIEASLLRAGQQTSLDFGRLEAQRALIRNGIERNSLIEVNLQGAVLDGHHGGRAAAEAGRYVDVLVRDVPLEPGLPLKKLPIRK